MGRAAGTRWCALVFVAAVLVVGCAKNTTTDPGLSAGDAPPAQVCRALRGERYEQLFDLLPPRIQEKANLRTLHDHLELPEGQYVKVCKVIALEETARREGESLRAKATYRFLYTDGSTGETHLYFVREGGRWWLLPSVDFR